QSSYHRGCALGPKRIRNAYDGHCYNATTESGIDLTGTVADLGDLQPKSTWELTEPFYRNFAEKLFNAEKIPFFAGGDHAVSVPVIEALNILKEPIHIVQIDAHPDLYWEFEGNRHSHACTAARILEMNHIASLTQLGIRTLNPAQSQQVERFQDRIHLYLAHTLTDEIPSIPHIPKGAFVYLTVDVDGFDPAFAPGVSHPVPGGLTSRQVLNLIHNAHWKLVGMDVVEVNPDLDLNDQTAILAARVLHEGMGYVARNQRADISRVTN
ncbi:MAG: arginase family protein, partial [bacterium]